MQTPGLAADIYFGRHCQKVIPAEPRTTIQPAYYDNYAFDGVAWALPGYAHFGDSYAAGMGTSNKSIKRLCQCGMWRITS
jgi:hypothetical protein